MTATGYDAIVIGADAGGLTAAAYLAHTGIRTLVLDAAPSAGGRLTRTLKLGETSVPQTPRAVCGIDPQIVRELQLEAHGCRFVECSAKTSILCDDDAPVTPSAAFIRALRHLWWKIQAPFDPDLRERVRRLDAVTLLKGALPSAAMQAGFAFDVMEGGMAPDEAGSAQTLLWRAAQKQRLAPADGFGALIEALSAAVAAGGAEIRYGAEAAQLLARDGQVAGVRLASGEIIPARIVLSALTRPHTQELLPLGAPWFSGNNPAQEVGEIRLVFLLKAPPAFGDEPTRLLFVKSLKTVLKAHGEARAGKLPASPAIEAVCEPAENLPGRHILSLRIRPFPLRPEEGWAKVLPKLVMEVLAVLETHAPGIKSSIEDLNLALPDDVGEVCDSRRLSASWRGRIATPFPGLFFCGLAGEPLPVFTGRAARIAARLARNYYLEIRAAEEIRTPAHPPAG